LRGVPTPMVSAMPTCCAPMSLSSLTTCSTSSGDTSPWYGQPSATEIAPRTLMPCFLAASTTGRKRSMLSAIEQLMFFWLNASVAAAKTTISSGHSARGDQRSSAGSL